AEPHPLQRWLIATSATSPSPPGGEGTQIVYRAATLLRGEVVSAKSGLTGFSTVFPDATSLTRFCTLPTPNAAFVQPGGCAAGVQ
ncbi:MAG: hypothetical protein JXB30_20215, partial [Anaerolineae bacterium]|nr:hypothetical protein [Anaerolineae bacterium]